MAATRVRALMTLAALSVTACSSSHTISTPTTGAPKASFCAVYAAASRDGRLRNWDLNDNPKTPAFTQTLRVFAAAAPPALRADVTRILSYYADPNPNPTPAEYEAGLRSGARVLAYVTRTCGIDTQAAPPPGDTSSTAP
jgi:hypothetical protein